jgi:hypothetical protein
VLEAALVGRHGEVGAESVDHVLEHRDLDGREALAAELLPGLDDLLLSPSRTRS